MRPPRIPDTGDVRSHAAKIAMDAGVNSGCVIKEPGDLSDLAVCYVADERGGYGVVSTGGKTTRAHRLCYQLCQGIDLTSKIDVCHKCDTRICVNPDHLFLGSRKSNMRDCIEKGRFSYIPVLRGEQSPNSKLTEDDVRTIRADTRSQRAIARAYGVDKGTIACIIHRKTWGHI